MIRILIADDDPIVLKGLCEFVDWKQMGFVVSSTTLSASAALCNLESGMADVLLTDIVMPEMSGLDLIEQARKTHPHLKAVVLSSYSEFEFAKEAIRLGASDYLTKPVDFNELKTVFSRLRAEIEQEESQRNALHELMLDHEQGDDPAGLDLVNAGPAVEAAVVYINEHYAEDLSLQTLSEIVYLHPTYLSRLFKGKTGENFSDYLIKVRIEHAQNLLGDLSLRISDVSRMVGYANAKHFSTLFKNAVGTTPREYRKSLHAIYRRSPASG